MYCLKQRRYFATENVGRSRKQSAKGSQWQIPLTVGSRTVVIPLPLQDVGVPLSAGAAFDPRARTDSSFLRSL